MFFWNKICGLGIFFLCACCFLQAQTSSRISFSNVHSAYKVKSIITNSVIHFLPSINSFVNAERLNPPISADYTTNKYGFFCKEELKMEKATKIPLRFRLGSLEQCNYYEGKRQ